MVDKSGSKNEVETSEWEVASGQVAPLDRNKKEIGTISAIGLIFNRMVGTGIFATTSTIFVLSGSVGLSLILWFVGSLISLAGLYVYMEFGSAITKNGGEKNYVEYVYRKPKFLASAMYASYVFFLGWASGNSIVFGEYILTAAGVTVTRWNERGIGIACVTFAFLVHSINVKAGVYLQNVLGLFKLVIILIITVTGWVALGGGISGAPGKANFHDSFSGTPVTGYGVVTALYNIIWSFIGYSNANYALGEVKNPIKTLRIAGPSAVICLAVIYMLVNIAYFAVVPLDELAGSGQIVASNFFRIAFGRKSEKALSVFVALSALGNVMSVIFSQGRIVQQLGREGILPFSKFFATQKPFNTPMVGLFEHWVVCVITIVAPPPGDAYNFILNLISYPLNIVNMFVAAGLLWLHYRNKKGKESWNPPIKATIPVTMFFLLSSIYLVVAPYVPPSAGQSVYNSLPYYLHCVVGIGIFAFGALYWVVWAWVLPAIGGYRLDSKEELGDDGFWRHRIVKVKNGQDIEEAVEEEQSKEVIPSVGSSSQTEGFETKESTNSVAF
ncbi:methionine permease [Brettanomyces nanus]|uniref:Methionine permease n=1 Tax=Eeniella nana TaxID=13502 RepID=A0A875S8T2_EENNA|nr:methionine permease [Brettanomyces nanus]QPG76079.1 methionine permease [Brettanomyces nanus]